MNQNEQQTVLQHLHEQTFGTVHLTDAVRVEHTRPCNFQLIKRGDSYVLQGCFEWREGNRVGFEWRDLPTIIEEQST